MTYLRPSVCALAILAALAGPAGAREAPLLGLELRLGTGLNVAGTTPPNLGYLPFSLGVGVGYAFWTEPWLSIYGELVIEGQDSIAIGAAGGFRIHFAEGLGRLSGGTTVLVVPAVMTGVTAAGGLCWDGGTLRLCGELQATFFVAGQTLPRGASYAQLQLVLVVGFDAL